MAGEESVSLDAGARAALQAKKPFVYVCPPAGWAVAPLLSALAGGDSTNPRLIALVPEVGDALDLARVLRPLPGFEPIHPVTGLTRAGRLIAADAVRTLIVTPRDAVRLAETSVLKLGGAAAVLLLWPELTLEAGETSMIDTLLAEAPEAQRVIVTSDATKVQDLVERHARRAPLAVAARIPEQPVTAARYVVVDGEKRSAAIRAILDTRNPASTLLWEPSPDRFERWSEFGEDPTVVIADQPVADQRSDIAIAAELPSADVLARLAQSTGEIIVLIRATQLPYLQRIARPLKTLRLPGGADRARERAQALRAALRERIEGADMSSELLALAPLFDEYDPAVVAAALARGIATPVVVEESSAPAWVRVQVTVGKRDRVRPADLVGALLNGVGLAKDRVGRVDIKDGFSIVEIRAEDAPRAIRSLGGMTIRGKLVTARAGN